MGFFMSDISTTELLETQATSTQMQIHTALPARVVSFDPSEQTVSIELMIEQINHNGEQLALPPLVDVPVKMFAYGAFMITAEPQAGDEGLATFSERCIDGWWLSSKKSVPMDIRFHDLSDAFFDGGYRSKPKALTIVPNCLNIAGASNYVRLLSDGTIEIKGNTTILGSLTVTGDVVGAGKSLSTHTHGGVQTGSGSTGTPQ